MKVLTPDSKPVLAGGFIWAGEGSAGFDKQFVRELPGKADLETSSRRRRRCRRMW